MHYLLALALLAAAQLPNSTSLVLIPAGDYTMGNPGSEERPPHRVSIGAFFLDEHEVTNAQYQVFCQATEAELPIFWGLVAFVLLYNFPYFGALQHANEQPRLFQTMAMVEEGRYAVDTYRHLYGYRKTMDLSRSHCLGARVTGAVRRVRPVPASLAKRPPRQWPQHLRHRSFAV